MTTNPKILELKEACARGDEAAIKAWVKSLQPAQVANYVKYALLHKNECPEIWQVLPFVDPNISMYGGDLLGNTASHGGLEKVKAPFSAPVGTRQEDLMNVVDTLWTYRHILEELQHAPQRLDALLSKDASDGWYAPEFVLDTNTLMKACVFYASLATYIQRTYLKTGFEVSDRSWAAGRAAVDTVSQSR